MMSSTPFDTQDLFQYNLHGCFDTADLTARNMTESIIVSGTMASSTGARSGMHPSSADHSMMRNMTWAITGPPLLPRILPIALPSLSPNIPVQIHALITHRPSISPIFWNVSLPPPTALLAIVDTGILNLIRQRSDWSRDVAAVPSVSSFTIRIRGVARPVVVFPVEAGLSIRIVDVLRTVYNAVRAEALGSRVCASDVPAYGAHGQGSRRDFAFGDAVAADAIRRWFRGRVWWNGLSQSTTEVDVWVLHLGGASRRRCRW